MEETSYAKIIGVASPNDCKELSFCIQVKNQLLRVSNILFIEAVI